MIGSSLFRTNETLAPSSRNRGANNRATRKRQIAFLDRLAVADLKPPLLHLCPVAAEMARVERDFYAGKRFLRGRRRQRFRWVPESRHRFTSPSLLAANRKVKNFCASRLIRIRAVLSFISIKSGANPWCSKRR